MVLAIAGPQSPWLALEVLTFGLCAARCSGPLCGLNAFCGLFAGGHKPSTSRDEWQGTRQKNG